MTDSLTRLLSVAAINLALATPAFALDPNFGDDTPTSPNSTPIAPSSSYNEKDDPLTLSVLRKLTLKQLKVDAQADQPDNVKDPLQPLNRKIYAFNDKLDHYILRPVANTYKKYVPTVVQTSVSNFFGNLHEPWDAINLMLQGRPKDSAKSLGRFTINTITTLGLADPASSLGWNRDREDFGQTLGVWGIHSGPYLMLPFYGPSTLRDTGALTFDYFGAPQVYMHSLSATYAVTGAEAVDTRAGLIGAENIVPGDQYSLIRDVYLQTRKNAISDNATGGSGAKDDSTPIDTNFGDDNDDSAPKVEGNPTP